jgi:hypothetical protein
MMTPSGRDETIIKYIPVKRRAAEKIRFPAGTDPIIG